MKLYDFDPEALQMAADGLRKAFREAGETIQRIGESFKKAFNDMIDEASRRQMQNREHRE